MEKNGRIVELNFIRAFCALGIVFYHFCPYSNNAFFKSCGSFCSGVDFGALCVTVFFILSGVVLFHNYREIESLKLFYWKRWRSIFPSFYIVYGIFMVNHLIKHRQWFANKPLYTLPLSLLGLDGYFSAAIPTWYLVGEWFLGGIILLYCLYPLLSRLFQRWELGTLAAVGVLFLLTSRFEMLGRPAFHNLFSCLFSFSMGILIEKHELYRKKVCCWAGLLGVLAFAVVPLHAGYGILNNFAGIFAFFALFSLGKYIMRGRVTAFLVNRISGVSYEIFLFQHIMIAKIVSIWNPASAPLAAALLLAICAVTYVAASVVSIGVKYLLKSKPFAQLERFVCRKATRS